MNGGTGGGEGQGVGVDLFTTKHCPENVSTKEAIERRLSKRKQGSKIRGSASSPRKWRCRSYEGARGVGFHGGGREEIMMRVVTARTLVGTIIVIPSSICNSVNRLRCTVQSYSP